MTFGQGLKMGPREWRKCQSSCLDEFNVKCFSGLDTYYAFLTKRIERYAKFKKAVEERN